MEEAEDPNPCIIRNLHITDQVAIFCKMSQLRLENFRIAFPAFKSVIDPIYEEKSFLDKLNKDLQGIRDILLTENETIAEANERPEGEDAVDELLGHLNQPEIWYYPDFFWNWTRSDMAPFFQAIGNLENDFWGSFERFNRRREAEMIACLLEEFQSPGECVLDCVVRMCSSLARSDLIPLYMKVFAERYAPIPVMDSRALNLSLEGKATLTVRLYYLRRAVESGQHQERVKYYEPLDWKLEEVLYNLRPDETFGSLRARMEPVFHQEFLLNMNTHAARKWAQRRRYQNPDIFHRIRFLDIIQKIREEKWRSDTVELVQDELRRLGFE